MLTRYRHNKRGSEYEAITESARVQASTRPIEEGDQVVVYMSDEGEFYVRLVTEFHDGRFTEVRTPLSRYSDEEIAAENYRRMVAHLGDQSVGVSVPAAGSEIPKFVPKAVLDIKRPDPEEPDRDPDGPLTYAKTGGPPDYWSELRVFSSDSGLEVDGVEEVNTEEGWVIRYILDSEGATQICSGDPRCPSCPEVGASPHARTEKIEGSFRIVRSM